MKKILALFFLLFTGSAFAQTSPNLTQGQVLTPAQWNQLFINKQDVLGYTPLNIAGGILTGRLVTAAPGATTAGLNLSPGTTPGSPVNGDIWITSSGFYAQVNGSTIGPLGIAVCPTCAVTNAPNTFLGTQTITPPSGTSNQGIVVTQTGPSSGGGTGPDLFNTITVTDAGLAPSGTGLDSFGQIQSQVNAFRVNMLVQGGAATKAAISAAANITGSSGGVYGGGFGTYQNVNATGNNWGLIGYANIGPSGVQTGEASAIECEILVATGGSLTNRACLSLNSQGPVAGSGIDAAIVVDVLPGTVTGYTGAPAPFTNFVYFSKNWYGANLQPIATTGNIFNSDTMTIANFANMANVTVTGNILSFPNAVIAGSGTAVFGAGTAGLINNTVVSQFNVNTSSGFEALNNSAGTSAFTGFAADNGTGAATFAIGGTGYTGAGGFLTNKAFVFSNASANGIAIYSSGAAPIDFYVNGARTGGFTTTGLFTLTGAIAMGTNAITGLTTLASAGAMTFQSNGSTLAGTITTGQKWGIGTETNPQAPFVISNNTATGIPVPTATIVAINGTDSIAAVLAFQSWGTGQNPTMWMRGARGTAASPSASQANDVLGFFSANGYAATAYDTAAQSGFYVGAGENHTLTANGTFLAFLTVPATTTARAEAMRIFGSGGVSVGNTTDPGIAGFSATNYFAGTTAGVTCSGTPTASFASTKGIVTHC